MKKKMFLRMVSALMGMFLLCACGKEKEEEIPKAEHVREEKTVAETKPSEDTDPDATEPEIAQPDPGNDPDEKAVVHELRDKILDMSGASEDDIKEFAVDDYDGDGSYEAFALVGKYTEDYGDVSLIEGDIWFADSDECEKICENSGMGYADDVRLMRIGDTSYVMFDAIFMTATITYVWYVDNKTVAEAEFSCCGQVIQGTENDRFCIMDSSYDATLDPDIGSMIGHTWKYYYFFYNDEEGRVNEYAGTAIDAATAEYMCGRDILAEIMSDDDKIDSIFCRGNGLIVINYEYDDAGMTNFEHYIYDSSYDCWRDDYGSELEEPVSQPGTCRSCLCPAIASYPEVPGPGDTVWYGE